MSEIKKDIFVTVGELHIFLKNNLDIRFTSGKKGINRKITSSKILEPNYFTKNNESINQDNKILLISETFIKIFRNFSLSKRRKVVKRIYNANLACIILVTKNKVPGKLDSMSNYHKIPLIVVNSPVSDVLEKITFFLSKSLCLRKRIHGVMMDISGVGVLMLGGSGVGKSENALDLIMRGHRLISDDVVELYEDPNGKLIGASPELTKNHMEIRGLGIINIKELFGVSSLGHDRKVELIIELEKWEEEEDYDRMGWKMKKRMLLGKEFPLIKIPVAPGRNLSTIIEIAVRVFLLRETGINPIKEIDKRLREWNSNANNQK